MKTQFSLRCPSKFSLLATCCLFIYGAIEAQTNTFPSTGAAGVGTTSPNASSLLEIRSTAKGFLAPRMTQAQRDAIASPAPGLLIYQTNNTPGFYYYGGSAWKAITPKPGWNLTGNAGTDSSINFLGTTDAHPLVFRVNNKKSGWIDYNSVIGGGSGNTALGYQALFANTTGSANVAMGYNALFSNTTGYYNTATGHSALYKNTTGTFNTANGYQALYNNTTGSNNTATGEGTLAANTTGGNNVANGERALNFNTTGHDNTANGNYALFFNTTGSYNTANGSFSFRYNTTGSYNTGNGYNALYSNSTGDYNAADGAYALRSNTSGSYNTATGVSALYSNTTASYNTATGEGSLYYNTTGSNNAANGYSSLYSNTTGTNNTATGMYSLTNNTTGNYNTANGYNALGNNTSGSNNTATGYGALVSTQGSDNTAVGYLALYSNTDNYNTAVGFGALYNNISGFNNSSLGIEADVSASNLVNSTAIGANAVVNASNKIRLGDGGITVVESNAGSWTTSDGRFKSNIKENVKGLEFIKLLKPVTYKFDTKKFQEFLIQNYPDSIKTKRTAAMDKSSMTKSSAILQSGFVAQDVAAAAKKIGYDFNGVHAPENSTDNWSLSYEKLVVPLVKAVQELSAKNDDLQKQIDDLKAMVASGSTSNTSSKTSASITLTDALIDQNNPNPFSHTTTIGYTLPQKFTSAQIVITDKGGKKLKSVNVSGSGRGSLNIDAATLSAGAYNYSFLVDGKLIATKQMIMAR